MGTPTGFNKILKTFEEQHQIYSPPSLKLFNETTGKIFNLTAAGLDRSVVAVGAAALAGWRASLQRYGGLMRPPQLLSG